MFNESDVPTITASPIPPTKYSEKATREVLNFEEAYKQEQSERIKNPQKTETEQLVQEVIEDIQTDEPEEKEKGFWSKLFGTKK